MLKFNDITPAGYTQYVEIDLGTTRMIVLSGQVAVDTQGNIVGKNDFEQQTDRIFSNIKNILEKAGGSMNDVVKINNYLTDLSKLPLFKNVRDKYVNTDQPPASTTVEVSRLVREEFLIEIEAMAIIKNH